MDGELLHSPPTSDGEQPPPTSDGEQPLPNPHGSPPAGKPKKKKRRKSALERDPEPNTYSPPPRAATAPDHLRYTSRPGAADASVSPFPGASVSPFPGASVSPFPGASVSPGTGFFFPPAEDPQLAKAPSGDSSAERSKAPGKQSAPQPADVAGPAGPLSISGQVGRDAKTLAKAVMETFTSFVEELRSELAAKPSSDLDLDLGWREGVCKRDEDAVHMREIVTMVSGALPQEFRSCFSTQIRALADALFHDFEQSMGHSSGLGLGTGCFGAAAAAALAERINALPSRTASNTIPMGWISVSSEVCYSIWGGRSLMQDEYLPSFVIDMENGQIKVDFPSLCALVHDAERVLAISQDTENASTYLKWLLGAGLEERHQVPCTDENIQPNLCQNIRNMVDAAVKHNPGMGMGNILSLWLEFLFGHLPDNRYPAQQPPVGFNKGPALSWMDDYETAIEMTTFGGHTQPTPQWFSGVLGRPLVLTKPLLQLWQLGMVRGFYANCRYG